MIEVGILLSIWPIVSLIMIPISTYMGENCRYLNMKKVLQIDIFLGLLFVSVHLLIPRSSSVITIWLILVTVACAATASCIGSLVDSVTLLVLGARSDLYGQQRLYASISWGLSSFLTGILIQVTGYLWVLIPVYCFFNVILLVISFFIKLDDGGDKGANESLLHGDNETDGDCRNDENFGDHGNNVNIENHETETENNQNRNVNEIIDNQHLNIPRLFFFLLGMTLIGMVFIIIASFLFIYYNTIWKASPTLLGMTTPFSILFEVPVFYYSSWFLNIWGVKVMMLVSHMLLLVRMGLYILLPRYLAMTDGSNYVALGIECLHGASFALCWAAGLHHIQKMAPERYKSTFVGIYCTLYNNAGGFVGNLVGGWIYETWGYKMLWTSTGIAVIISGIVFQLAL